MYEYLATVKHITDGDTVDLWVDCGFHITVTIKVRLSNIDAPELPTPEGEAAKAYIASLLPVNSTCIIHTAKHPLDKWGRWLGIIWNQMDTSQPSVNDLMVSSGNAVPYMVVVSSAE